MLRVRVEELSAQPHCLWVVPEVVLDPQAQFVAKTQVQHLCDQPARDNGVKSRAIINVIILTIVHFCSRFSASRFTSMRIDVGLKWRVGDLMCPRTSLWKHLKCHWSVIVNQGGYDRLLEQWDDGGSFGAGWYSSMCQWEVKDGIPPDPAALLAFTVVRMCLTSCVRRVSEHWAEYSWSEAMLSVPLSKQAKKHFSSSASMVLLAVVLCDHVCWVNGGEMILNLLCVHSLRWFYFSIEVVSGSAIQLFAARSEGCITVFQRKLDILCHQWFSCLGKPGCVFLWWLSPHNIWCRRAQ